MAELSNPEVPIREGRSFLASFGRSTASQVSIENRIGAGICYNTAELQVNTRQLAMAIMPSLVIVVFVRLDTEGVQDLPDKPRRVILKPARRNGLPAGRTNDEPSVFDTDGIAPAEQFPDGNSHWNTSAFVRLLCGAGLLCVPFLDLAGQPGIQLGNNVVGRRLATAAELDGFGEGQVFLAQLVQPGAGLADGFANFGLGGKGLVDRGVTWVHLNGSVWGTGRRLGKVSLKL